MMLLNQLKDRIQTQIKSLFITPREIHFTKQKDQLHAKMPLLQ